MRRLLLIIIFAVLGSTLASAYVVGGSLTFDLDAVSPPSPNRYYDLRLDASLGRFDGYFLRDASGMAMTRSGYPATVSDWHLHAQGSYAGLAAVNTFGIYECVAHRLARHAGVFIYEISVPVWPFAVLCFIPLLLWLRKRTLKRDCVGFPVGAAE